MDKITTINGILLATQNDMNEHAENKAMHVTEKEKTSWDSKADTAALITHETNDVVHITEEERKKWNTSPEVDAVGNMTLTGTLTARSGIFSSPVQANGGLQIQVAPVTDADAVRKGDLARPLIPMLSSQQENGVGFYHILGSAFTAGDVTTCTSEDFPFIMSEHRVIGGGDDNLYAWFPTTFVLELNALFNYGRTDTVNAATAKFGVRANFGPCSNPWYAVSWLPWPPAVWPYRQNDYVDPVIYADTENGRDNPVASVWPGNTGSDFLPRCGFQSTQRADRVRNNKHYLYAVYDRYKTARFIVFRETNSHYDGRKRLYLFSQDRDGSVKLIGAVKSNYSFSHHILSMSKYGVSGVAGWWAERDDPFNLASKIQESWIEGKRPADDCSWPLRQSLFEISAEGGTLDIELTCENKSYTCINCPDWIIWQNGEDGTGVWQLIVAPNATSEIRQGLVNVSLYNGITYTIIVNQQVP